LTVPGRLVYRDGMSGNLRSRRPMLVVAAGVVLLAVAGLLVAGSFSVPEGEVIAARRGGDLAIHEPGRHWRLPVGDERLRLPRAPLEASVDLSARSREGAEVVVRLAGGFAVAAGRERAWLAAGGWKPFLDGVRAVAEQALGRHVAAIPATDLLGDTAAAPLAELLTGALAGAGVTVGDAVVSLPSDANPALAALSRHEAERLVSRERAARRKVLVLGWDAADWLILRPLMDAGRMPNLARLVRSGASGDLQSTRPLLSPIVWTTIASGKPMMEHGIVDFVEVDRSSGERVPVTSTTRKVHTLWTIATAMGLRSDVVGYWATWPAEKILGRMITERVAYQLFSFARQDDPEGKVHPTELWPRVADLVVPADRIGYEQVRRFLEIEREEFDRAWDSLPPERRTENKINHFRKILAATETYQRISLELLKEQADLSIFYFEGTDTVCHLFANEMPPPLAGVSAEDIRKYGGAVTEFYEWADELLGQLLARIADDTVVVIVSDHGFYTGELRPDSDPADFLTGAAEWHRPTGMIVAAGAGVAPARIEGASVFDVTPTVLALLGLPVPTDVKGRVLEAALPAGVRASVGKLASYETMPRPETAVARGSAAADRERLQELAALGYISPGGSAQPRPAPAVAPPGPAGAPPGGEGAAAAAPTPLPAPEGLPAMSAEELAERGTYSQELALGAELARNGDLAGAKVKYLRVVQLAPGFGPAYQALAETEQKLGDPCGAMNALAQGALRSQTPEPSFLPDMVAAARLCGRIDAARTALERAAVRYAATAEYAAAQGLLAETGGDPEAALSAYRTALERSRIQPVALDRSITLLTARGDDATARQLFREAIAAASNSLPTLNSFVSIALAHEWGADAEAICLRILNSDPGNVGVRRNLGVARLKQGKLEAARADLEAAARPEDGDALTQYYLGFLDALEGKMPGALARFARAEALGLRSADLYVARARALFFLQDRDGAEAALRQALEADAGNAEARKLLALLERARGGGGNR